MSLSWKWPKLHLIIPEGKCGNAEVRHVAVSKKASEMTNLRAIINHRLFEFVSPGIYVKLLVNGSTMMSNTNMEQDSNWEVVYKAHGHVLIAGLGLGMVTIPVCKKREVKSVTVVEINPDVIALVEPYIRHKKLTIIQEDIFKFKSGNGIKYDTLWFDIWTSVCIDNLEEIKKLHNKFKFKRDRENPDSWMSSWMLSYLKDMQKKHQSLLAGVV